MAATALPPSAAAFTLWHTLRLPVNCPQGSLQHTDPARSSPRLTLGGVPSEHHASLPGGSLFTRALAFYPATTVSQVQRGSALLPAPASTWGVLPTLLSPPPSSARSKSSFPTVHPCGSLPSLPFCASLWCIWPRPPVHLASWHQLGTTKGSVGTNVIEWEVLRSEKPRSEQTTRPASMVSAQIPKSTQQGKPPVAALLWIIP